MSSVDDAVTSVQKKIDRERALINAANAMRQSTNNPAVLSRLDGQIKDGRRNIEYFESKLRDLDVQRTAAGVDGMSLQPGASGSRNSNNPLTPPPKDGWNGYPDAAGYGAHQSPPLMPPSAPFAQPPPGSNNKRPNYSKLGTSPHSPMTPRTDSA
jgi:hypothetical protein